MVAREKARRGEIIQIKTLISHIMENGQRRDKDGNIIPRKIINTFICEFNGRQVFGCDLDTAVAANPYLQFAARIEESGTFRFTWRDDDGSTMTAEENVTVIG
jgi:sulfur-oxidizing protein SoxZ